MDQSDRIGCGEEMDDLREVFENFGGRMIDTAMDMVAPSNVCPFCGQVHGPQQQQQQQTSQGNTGVCPTHGPYGRGYHQPATSGCTGWGDFAPTFFGAFSQRQHGYQQPPGYTGYSRPGSMSPTSPPSGFGSSFGSFFNGFGNSFGSSYGSNGGCSGSSRGSRPGLHVGNGLPGYGSYSSSSNRRPNLGPSVNSTSNTSSATRPANNPSSYGTGYSSNYSSSANRSAATPSYGTGYSSNNSSSYPSYGSGSAGASCGPRG